MSLDYGSRTCRDCDRLVAEIDRLCAELAEVSRNNATSAYELLCKTEHWKVERTLRLEAEARLAEVIALCDDLAGRPWLEGYGAIRAVRAAVIGDET